MFVIGHAYVHKATIWTHSEHKWWTITDHTSHWLSTRPSPRKWVSIGAVALTNAFCLLGSGIMDCVVSGFISYLMQCNSGDKINQTDDTIIRFERWEVFQSNCRVYISALLSSGGYWSQKSLQQNQSFKSWVASKQRHAYSFQRKLPRKKWNSSLYICFTQLLGLTSFFSISPA